LREEKQYDSSVMNDQELIREAQKMSEKARGEMTA
jgi:hypothetical protein